MVGGVAIENHICNGEVVQYVFFFLNKFYTVNIVLL